MSGKEDKEEQEGNVSLVDDDHFIPQGPYPPMPKWQLNYFDISPQGTVSHFTLIKNTEMVRKHRDMTKALNSFAIAKGQGNS